MDLLQEELVGELLLILQLMKNLFLIFIFVPLMVGLVIMMEVSDMVKVVLEEDLVLSTMELIPIG
jgi:hypothetical protein